MKNLKKRLRDLSLFDKILMGLVVLLVFFFAYAFFRKSTYITINVKVGEEDVVWEHWSRAWFSQLFYKGMKEKDGLGRVNAEVLDVHSYDVTFPENDTLIAKKAVYLKLKVKAIYSRSSNQYTYKGLPVLVGSPIRMYLDSVLVEGLVTNIGGIKDPREKKILIVEAQVIDESPTYLETSGTKVYIADALRVGQKIQDDQGNTIIEIFDKKVENAKKVINTSDGRVLVGVNPLRKDVYLTMRINAIQLNNKYYFFDDIPISIGLKIPLNTPTLTILPEVTKITVQE